MKRIAWNKGLPNTWSNGSKSNFWRGGLPKCKDCNVCLKKMKSIRCVGCYAKYRIGKKSSLQARINLSNAIRGENHWNWRGGDRNLQSRIRKSLVYRLWHIEILKRDNFRCQDCSEIGGRLEVNHKISFAELNVKYNIKSVEEAEACKELWRLDRDFAETLCKKCHKEKTRGQFHARAIVYGQPKHYSKNYLLRTGTV